MAEQECPFCYPQEKYAHLNIAEFNHWRLALHESQVYLGRCLLIARRHFEDFFQTTDDERGEFFAIGRNLRDILQSTFGADMCNYATLGNEVNHHHWHVLPRYKKPVEFAGVVFEDKRWGQNYAPYDKNFTVPMQTILAIRDILQKNI